MIRATQLFEVINKARFVELHCAVVLAHNPVLFGTPEQLKFQRRYAFEIWNQSYDDRRIALFVGYVSELEKADPKNGFFTKRRFIQLAMAFAAELGHTTASPKARRNFGMLWDKGDGAEAYTFFLLQYGKKLLGKFDPADLLVFK